MKLISIVVPCYNEEEALPFFYKAICEVAEGMKSDVNFEFLFINDGSKDKTLDILRELSSKDKRVRYVSFSRNFGKEAGMYAGLQNAKGDFVAIMDADMQDPPSLLPQMYKGIVEEGYDCVASYRGDRKSEPPIRSFFARMFYKIINKISTADIVDGARDFRLMTRQMVDAILSISEYNRFSKGIFGWIGFDTKWIEFKNVERVAGQTKWSFWKLFIYSLEGIVAFSTAPLALASVMGIVMCFLALITMLFFIVKTLVFGDPVTGYPSMISIILFIGGLQFLVIGILGQYLAKTYLETKNRPIYIVKETEKSKKEQNNEKKQDNND